MATSDNQNVWFGISMGLMGLIIGFVGGNFMSVSLSPAGSNQQIAAPQAPTAPQQPQPAPAAKVVKPVDPKRDHIRGNPKAKIAIIEYSDYECPFCSRVHPTIKQVMEKYGDDIMWVYRHFPLSFHANATPAAIASECIAEIGGNDAFWKFTDIVFEEKIYDGVTIAKRIGVDDAKVKTCIDSKKYANYVQTDMNEGSAAGVTGTPGNIIYNVETKESRIVAGAQPFENFVTNIDAMLGK